MKLKNALFASLLAAGLMSGLLGTAQAGTLRFASEAPRSDTQVAAAEKMKADGWWWRDASLSNKRIRRLIFKEMFTRRAG